MLKQVFLITRSPLAQFSGRYDLGGEKNTLMMRASPGAQVTRYTNTSGSPSAKITDATITLTKPT